MKVPRPHPRAWWWRIHPPRWEFQDVFDALGPGSLCVDCGANVGRYTELMAASGATVHAFEPNPWAFRALTERVGGRPNVHLRQAAVAATAGTTRLYLHHLHTENPVGWSAGSSLLREKSNVAGEGIDVELVALPEFIAGLGRRVDLLKVDVEGMELELIEALHEAGLLGSVGCALVEMHDGIAGLRERGQRVRELVAAQYPNVRLDWE